MIVKFHARGAGRGSGPVDYLLGKDRARDGATLDRGDPDAIQDLIDSSPYAKKYTSGVLSFEESDLDRATKDKIMSSFEKALLPGLDADQYSCLWVEHRDKGRLELNFVVPNV
nr:mobilization relaxase [Vibrio anguillarum]